ncbi:MAG: FliO/MopB family protein [Magnetococcales bacterium]|nr:FliO/MopB family protein [Magnetococcales bacterium]MBF0116290.1 FliO/MopB family protein [Magnetococcales bacterium]
MRCFGVDVRRLLSWLVVLSVVAWGGVATAFGAQPPAAMVEGRPAAMESKPVVESKTLPESRGMFAEVAKMVPFQDQLGDAFWKVVGALLVFIALALLVIRLGRRIRPQWRNGGPIFVEDGRNLAPGVGVRLLRVGSRYWLVGVTRERVTLIGELSEEDLLDEVVEEEEADVEFVSSRVGRHGRAVQQGSEPSLLDRDMRR